LSRLFISHSSADNAEAVAIRDWLASAGWDDVFLDLDAERGIAAGERWERALNQAASRCEAVLFLISRHWLESRWCLKEFNLARKLNKRLFGVLIEGIPLKELPADLTGAWQLVDLDSGQDHTQFRVTLPRTHEELHVSFSAEGLTRLRTGLARAGLDPRFFAWPPEHDPNRPPYRGLKALEAEDAGIFFGRDAPIVDALDTLRGLREGAAPRLLVILGASGAGKSSFLRAGLLPRLSRDDRNFLALPVIRPEKAAISGENGLIRALETALAERGFAQSRASLRNAIAGGAERVRLLLAALIEKASIGLLLDEGAARKPVVVLAIDQAEELFIGDGADEGQALLTLISGLVTGDDPGVIALFTIRSDSYDRLETAKAFEGMRQQALPLLPMPRGAYQTVIEGPAARLKDASRTLTIEPRLTQQLLADIDAGGGSDALPLLAFTLEQLYLDYGGSGALTLANYQAFGGVRGAIEAAVKRALAAADNDARIPRDAEARLTLLRRGLIPWLAGIDPETGSPRRRIARLADIPPEAAPLIQLLVEQRLLATDRIVVHDGAAERSEVTIEPAHEALLRQWGLLRGWLEEDLAALTTLEGVKRAARDWAANARHADWLNHAGSRLEDAETIAARPDLANDLSADDRAYLRQCREQEENQRRERLARLEREREEQERQLRDAQALLAANKRTARRTGIGLVAALVLAALAGWSWWIAQNAADEARKQTKIAQEQTKIALEKTELAQAQTQRAEEAAREAAAQRDRAVQAQSRAMAAVADLRINDGDAGTGLLLAIEAADQHPSLETEAALINGRLHLRELAVLPAARDEVSAVGFSPDGRLAVSAAGDTAEVWQAGTGKRVAVLSGHGGAIRDARFGPDSKTVATASDDGTARLWSAESGKVLFVLREHTRPVVSVDFSFDGKLLVTASDDQTARVWNVETGKRVSVLAGHTKELTAAVFSPDGTLVLTTGKDGTSRTWTVQTGTQLAQFTEQKDWIWKGAFNADGKRVVTPSLDGSAAIWESATGKLIVKMQEHAGRVFSAAFIPNSNNLVTASYDRTARIWDGRTGATVAVLAHQGAVMRARPSNDGRFIVTSSADRTAKIWRAETGQPFATLAGHGNWVMDAVFSPDGRRVITAGRDRTARLWSDSAVTIATGQRTWPGVRTGDAGLLWRAAISPDGRTVAAPSEDDSARIYDAATGAVVRTFTGHTRAVSGVAFDPSGRRIVTHAGDATARIWDVATGRTLAVLRGHEGFVLAAAFSADGKRVVTTAVDKTAKIWDADSGRLLVTLTGHTGAIIKVAFSPDGSRVLTVSPFDSTARLWDAQTGQPAERGVLSRGNAMSGAFSPDGKRILIASLGITAYDAATGDFIDEWFGAFGERVMDIAYTPDGRYLLLGLLDGTARILNAENSRPVSILTEFGRAVWTVAVSADGRRLVTASDVDTLRVAEIPLHSGDRLNDLRAALPRCLRSNERTELNLAPDPPDWCLAMNKWPNAGRAWRIWQQHRNDATKPPQPGAVDWLNWLTNIGNSLLAKEPAQALEAYEENASRWKELYEGDSENPARKRLYALSLLDVGRALKALSKYDDAVRNLAQAFALYSALAAAEPTNVVLQDGSAYMQEQIAEAKSAQRKYGEAVAAYRIALQFRAKVAAASSDVAKQVALAITTEKLAEALLEDKKTADALKYARDDLTLRQKLSALEPNNLDRQENVAYAWRLIADALAAIGGRGPESIAAYKESLAIRMRLADAEPAKATRHSAVAFTDEKLAEALLAAGANAEALGYARDAVAVRRKVLQLEDTASRQRDLIYALRLLGNVLKVNKSYAESADAYREVAAIRKALAAAEPDDTSKQRDLASAYNDLAMALAAAGKADDAVTEFRAALRVREALAARSEREEVEAKGAPGGATASAMGNIAWYALFAREFSEALRTSQRGVELAPDLIWLKTNMAHALMFLGRTDEARVMFLQYRGKRAFTDSNTLWEQSVTEDFALFRTVKLSHPLMDEIEAAFRK
jgi:WD40 repeat protein/tetratricopeptide (TPR) repeat protein